MILLIINLKPKTVKYSLTERGGNLSTKEIPNIPSNAELENLADLYRAMGDNTRMHLLWSLMSGEACVGALASDMDITESAVSHQLRSLRAARLVKSRKAGKHVYYSLSDDHASWILQKTCEHIRER